YGVPNYYELVFVAGDKTIKADKATLQAFLRGAQKGYEFMKKNPDEALQILLNHEEKENYPLIPEVEKQSMQILLKQRESKYEPFLSQTAKSWEEQSKWLKEKGMAKKEVAPTDLYENLV